MTVGVCLCVCLQGAAGTFQLLQEQVFAHLQTAPTPDLSAECTTALVGLMLAQAQESFCVKAGKGDHDMNKGLDSFNDA